jgi:hypothetical protein
LDFIGKAPGADLNKLFAILAATVKERLLCACAYHSPCLTPSNLKKYQGKLLSNGSYDGKLLLIF